MKNKNIVPKELYDALNKVRVELLDVKIDYERTVQEDKERNTRDDLVADDYRYFENDIYRLECMSDLLDSIIKKIYERNKQDS